MTSNSIIPFAFESQPVRVIDRDGDLWFVANDVCDVLQITDAAQAVDRLDDEERGRYNVPTPSGDQVMRCINESGLYSLILTSRKPAAKRFKRWVTAEVLPAIRKTGSYSVGGAKVEDASDWKLARERRLSMTHSLKMAALAGLAGNQRLIAANRATRATTGFDYLSAMGLAHMEAPEPEVLLTPTALGKQLGSLSAVRVNHLLAEHGYQIGGRDPKGWPYWEPTEKGIAAGGHMVELERSNKTGEARQLRWASGMVETLRRSITGEVA